MHNVIDITINCSELRRILSEDGEKEAIKLLKRDLSQEMTKRILDAVKNKTALHLPNFDKVKYEGM
jgi:hypothetical protein